MKKYIILSIICACSINASCTRKNSEHGYKETVRCELTQEDISRGYAQNPKRYGDVERYRECFYCGCKLNEHTHDEQRCHAHKRRIKCQ